MREFGRVVFAQATTTSIFIVLDPRLEDALVRFIPMVENEIGPRAGTTLFRRALMLDAGIGLTFAAVGVALLQWRIIPMGEVGNRGYFMLAVFQSGVQAALGTAIAGFSVTNGLARLGFLQAVTSVVTAGSSVLGLLVWGAHGYLFMFAVGTAASTAGLGLAALRRVRKFLGTPGPLPDAWMGRFLRFSLVASLTSSVRMGADSFPLSIVGFVGGASMLASFRVALAPARLVTVVFGPLSAVYFPVLSREAVAERYASVKSMVLKWTRMSLPAVVAMGGAAWIVLFFAVPAIFGSKFGASVQPARYLVFAALIRGTIAWSKVLALAVGRTGFNLVAASLDAALLVGATAWVASYGGAADIAASHLAVSLIVLCIWIRFALRLRP